jgi:hypothetical protein
MRRRLNGSPDDHIYFIPFIFIFHPGVALLFQFMNFIEFRLQSRFMTCHIFKRRLKLGALKIQGRHRIFCLPRSQKVSHHAPVAHVQYDSINTPLYKWCAVRNSYASPGMGTIIQG